MGGLAGGRVRSRNSRGIPKKKSCSLNSGNSVLEYLLYVIQRQEKSVPKPVLHLCRSKIDFLHNVQKHHKNQYNLNILFAHQNSPREVPNFFFTRLGRNGRAALKLSYVCGGFNENKIASSFACVYQPRSARRVFRYAHIFALRKKSACSPSAVNEFDKTYSTSPAPLLVRNVQYVCGAVARDSRNISKIKLKKHRIP